MPTTEIIMLTVSEDADDLLEALRAGARGYLLKNIETEFLLDAIRRAAAGESVMSSQMTAKLADAMRTPQTVVNSTNPEKLTPREREIILAVSRLKCKKCSMMLPKIKCVWCEQLSRAFEP